MPNEKSLKQQEKQTSKFRPYVRGFTLELEEPSDQNRTEDWEHHRTKVWQNAVKVLELAPENFKLLIIDSYSPDLIEATINSEFSIAQAWELVYRLRRVPGVIYAEPRFSLLMPNERTGRPGPEKALEEREIEHLPSKTKNPEWSLSQMRVQDAWQEFFTSQGKEPGEGVVIGHPDTGYLPHPELETALGIQKGFDFSESDETQKESYSINNPDDNILANLGHGTATASLIISPKNLGTKAHKQGNGKDVIGVAYGAKIIPLRIRPCSQDAEVFSPGLAAAINKAAELNVDIISISMGGYPSLAVRKAIVNAQKKGIIVVASAGHEVPFAVWPAAYDQVVAVAASTANEKVAKFSSIGSRIDVAAPGEAAWCATAEKINGKLTYTVRPQSGTSFSTALVAGVAALWLSHHGRDKLIQKYGAWRVPLVFDKLLRQTCSAPAGWDKNNWGAGIVNAYNLLEACLPEVDDPGIQVPLAFGSVEHVLLDRGGFETFAYLFEQTLLEIAKANSTANSLDIFPRVDIIQSVLSKLLGKSGKDLRMHLRTFGQELAFHFGINSSLYKQMENALKFEAGLQTVPEYPLDKVRDELREYVSEYLKAQLPATAAPT